MKSILDKSFKYKPSHSTDVSKTWAARKKLAEDKAKREEIVKQLPTIGRKANARG